MKATKEEINKLKTEGANDQDIVKFSTEENRQYELHLRENEFWLNWLSSQYENGDDPGAVLTLSGVDQTGNTRFGESRCQYLSERK